MADDAHYIENKTNIRALAEKMDIIISNMETQMHSMQESMDSNFKKLDKKIDGVSEDLQALRSDLPHTIDERIKENNANRALSIIKWVVISAGGAVIISVITRLVLTILHLN